MNEDYKLLFDQNISFRIVKKLSIYFPDCQHISDCGLLNCTDEEIWGFAKKNQFVIVTFDTDFYDMSVINGFPPKVIWIRTGNKTTNSIVELIALNQKIITDFMLNKGFSESSCLELI